MKTIILDFDGTIVDLKTQTALTSRRTLKMLSREYNLVLITGSPRKEVNYFLDKFSWRNVFRLIITKDDSRYSKKTGIPFKKALLKIRGPVVAIGDSESDVSGCKKAKIPLISIKEPKDLLVAFKQAALALDTMEC